MARTRTCTIKQWLDNTYESFGIPSNDWAREFIKALIKYDIINKNEFDELIKYIKK